MKSCLTCLRGPDRSPTNVACHYCDDDLDQYVPGLHTSIEFDEDRMDRIGQNGNTAEHYGESYLTAHGVLKAQYELNAKAREMLDSLRVPEGPQMHYDHIKTLDDLAGLGRRICYGDYDEGAGMIAARHCLTCDDLRSCQNAGLSETVPGVVNHPPHYTSHKSGVECIQVTEHMNFCLGNALKYIWRADEKGKAIEDLEKARWYIDREIERRKGYK